MGIRPSSLLAIDDPYVAYCFDQAAGYLGNHVELELDKIGNKTDAKERAVQQQKKAKLEAILSGSGDKPKQQFADPALMFK